MAEATVGQPQNPKSQGAAPAGDKPDYLVEKFGSVEDQAKGYRELEKKYHEDLNTIKQELASLKQGVRVEDTRTHELPPDDDNQELVEFYKSPSAYRRRVIDEAKQELRVETVQREALRDVLSNFFQKNPDLVGQEPLLEWYVRQEDPRLTPTDRLQNAAKHTREHIVNLRKAPEPKPNPLEFVDEPSGAQPRAVSKSEPTEKDLRTDFFKTREGSRKLAPKRLPQGE